MKNVLYISYHLLFSIILLEYTNATNPTFLGLDLFMFIYIAYQWDETQQTTWILFQWSKRENTVLYSIRK